MKKLILFVIAFSYFIPAKSQQLDVSTNPFFLLFEIGVVSVDKTLSKNFGIGLDLTVSQDFSAIYFNGKYYFMPREGADGVHMGIYSGFARDNEKSDLGFGVLIGTKRIYKRNIIFELSGGVGGGLGTRGEKVVLFFPYAKFNFGYRFNIKTQKK